LTVTPFLGLDFDPFSGEKNSSSNTTGATCGAGTAYPSEHPSFWAIMKLCSFSWTFPENSRRPGGFYFYMMFMIPEVLINFAMKNYITFILKYYSLG
jgi:hypothetical protein